MLTKREAKRDGKARGIAAASWKFDGNTTKATYRVFLKGLEDGDPSVMEQYAPPAWLSGEWAGESLSEILGDIENERDEMRADDVAQAYEEAADSAYWGELARVARLHLED